MISTIDVSVSRDTRRRSTEPLRVRPLPRPEHTTRERRRQRSNCTADALELALTYAAARGRLDAIVLVDDMGMLVAQSKTQLDLTMLAAVTPIVGRGRAIPRIHYKGKLRSLSVRPVEVDDELLYVAALGGEQPARRRELMGSAAATRRILLA